jgi:hypothetical protein
MPTPAPLSSGLAPPGAAAGIAGCDEPKTLPAPCFPLRAETPPIDVDRESVPCGALPEHSGVTQLTTDIWHRTAAPRGRDLLAAHLVGRGLVGVGQRGLLRRRL